MALIENIQRADLNPLEEAEAMQRLIAEFSVTHQEAAEAVGRSRAAVTNLLRLLELTREVQDLVRKGDLEMGHARALLALKGPAQTAAGRQVLKARLAAPCTVEATRCGSSARITMTPIASSTLGVPWPIGYCHELNSP